MPRYVSEKLQKRKRKSYNASHKGLCCTSKMTFMSLFPFFFKREGFFRCLSLLSHFILIYTNQDIHTTSCNCSSYLTFLCLVFLFIKESNSNYVNHVGKALAKFNDKLCIYFLLFQWYVYIYLRK